MARRPGCVVYEHWLSIVVPVVVDGGGAAVACIGGFEAEGENGGWLMSTQFNNCKQIHHCGKTNIEKRMMIVGSGEKIKISRNEKEKDENNERERARKKRKRFTSVFLRENMKRKFGAVDVNDG